MATQKCASPHEIHTQPPHQRETRTSRGLGKVLYLPPIRSKHVCRSWKGSYLHPEIAGHPYRRIYANNSPSPLHKLRDVAIPKTIPPPTGHHRHWTSQPHHLRRWKAGPAPVREKCADFRLHNAAHSMLEAHGKRQAPRFLTGGEIRSGVIVFVIVEVLCTHIAIVAFAQLYLLPTLESRPHSLVAN